MSALIALVLVIGWVSPAWYVLAGCHGRIVCMYQEQTSSWDRVIGRWTSRCDNSWRPEVCVNNQWYGRDCYNRLGWPEIARPDNTNGWCVPDSGKGDWYGINHRSTRCAMGFRGDACLDPDPSVFQPDTRHLDGWLCTRQPELCNPFMSSAEERANALCSGYANSELVWNQLTNTYQCVCSVRFAERFVKDTYDTWSDASDWFDQDDNKGYVIKSPDLTEYYCAWDTYRYSDMYAACGFYKSPANRRTAMVAASTDCSLALTTSSAQSDEMALACMEGEVGMPALYQNSVVNRNGNPKWRACVCGMGRYHDLGPNGEFVVVKDNRRMCTKGLSANGLGVVQSGGCCNAQGLCHPRYGDDASNGFCSCQRIADDNGAKTIAYFGETCQTPCAVPYYFGECTTNLAGMGLCTPNSRGDDTLIHNSNVPLSACCRWNGRLALDMQPGKPVEVMNPSGASVNHLLVYREWTNPNPWLNTHLFFSRQQIVGNFSTMAGHALRCDCKRASQLQTLCRLALPLFIYISQSGRDPLSVSCSEVGTGGQQLPPDLAFPVYQSLLQSLARMVPIAAAEGRDYMFFGAECEHHYDIDGNLATLPPTSAEQAGGWDDLTGNKNLLTRTLSDPTGTDLACLPGFADPKQQCRRQCDPCDADRGACDTDTGLCKCLPGWSGPMCKQPVCPRTESDDLPCGASASTPRGRCIPNTTASAAAPELTVQNVNIATCLKLAAQPTRPGEFLAYMCQYRFADVSQLCGAALREAVFSQRQINMTADMAAAFACAGAVSFEGSMASYSFSVRQTQVQPCTCNVRDGFWGTACERRCPDSPYGPCGGASRGLCDSTTGRCNCREADGYSGNNCTLVCPSRNGKVCNGQGTCVPLANGLGQCVCTSRRWGGSDCAVDMYESCVAPDQRSSPSAAFCSGVLNGACVLHQSSSDLSLRVFNNATYRCVCNHPTIYGQFCEKRLCEGCDSTTRGSCVQTSRLGNWRGLSVQMTRQAGGVPAFVCNCSAIPQTQTLPFSLSPYAGARCEVKDDHLTRAARLQANATSSCVRSVSDLLVCSGNGWCEVDYDRGPSQLVCRCLPGYSGTFCERKSCAYDPAKEIDTAHWMCNDVTGQWACTSPMWDHMQNCQVNRCLHGGVPVAGQARCYCPTGWTGADCSQKVPCSLNCDDGGRWPALAGKCSSDGTRCMCETLVGARTPFCPVSAASPAEFYNVTLVWNEAMQRCWPACEPCYGVWEPNLRQCRCNTANVTAAQLSTLSPAALARCEFNAFFGFQSSGGRPSRPNLLTQLQQLASVVSDSSAQCNHNGVAVGDAVGGTRCICVAPFTAESRCANHTCGLNGLPDPQTGECQCSFPYTGATCRDHECQNGGLPSLTGGSCKCVFPFTGPRCDTMRANWTDVELRAECSQHGVFDVAQGKCSCEAGWISADCSRSRCANGGVPINQEECQCTDGWNPATYCQTPLCTLGKAQWNRTSQRCECLEPYRNPPHCLTHSCQNGGSPDTLKGRCVCPMGFDGKNCQCSQPETESLHGQCVLVCRNGGQFDPYTRRCVCPPDSDWFGELCERSALVASQTYGGWNITAELNPDQSPFLQAYKLSGGNAALAVAGGLFPFLMGNHTNNVTVVEVQYDTGSVWWGDTLTGFKNLSSRDQLWVLVMVPFAVVAIVLGALLLWMPQCGKCSCCCCSTSLVAQYNRIPL